MPELGQSSFDAGWTPAVDARNAPESGLLRLDNMNLDDKGVLTSLRGKALASEVFGSEVRNIWSKRFHRLGETKHFRYAHTANGDIYSTNGVVSSLVHDRQILTGGNEFIAAFGHAAGYSLICSGTQKKKDDGSSVIRDLGIVAPTEAPIIDKFSNYYINFTDNFASFLVLTDSDGNQGTIISAATNYIQVRPNATSSRIILRSDGAFNFADFSDGSKVSPYDKFVIKVTGSKESPQTYVQINFMTIARPNPYDPNDLVSSFSRTFIVNGLNTTQTFEIDRQDFYREAVPGIPLEWNDIKQIEIIVSTNGTSETDYVQINSGFFYTAAGNLSGTYQWVQVNAFKHPENGVISLSPVGIESTPLVLNNERVKITPQEPPGWGTLINQIWIFRRRVETFDSYYRSGLREDIGQFEDVATDRYIIGRIGDIENIDDDRTAIPVRIDWFVENPPDNITDIAGPYLARSVYITEDKIYFSRIGDPDSVDSRYTLDVSGNSSERNLWIRQVGPSQLFVGTNIDIYIVAGTLRSFEDGSIDVLIRPLGVDSPPISRRVTSFEDNLIYMSKEGWRMLNGSSSILLTGYTDGLYNEKDYFGFGQVFIDSEVTRRYDCAVSRSRLYCIVHHDPNIPNPLNRERTLLVYDFVQKYWYATDLAPTCLWTEEHGVVLAGFGNSYYSLDRPDVYATPSNDILIRTPFITGGQPNNRKDTETLKIYANSNSQLIGLYIYVDGSDDPIFVGNYSWNGPSLKTIDIEGISGVSGGKSFSIEFRGTSLSKEFKLFYWNINYTARPEQKNFLHVPPTNFGVAGRKRFYDIPFSLDTLGSAIEVSPVLDGVSLTPISFDGSLLGKQFFTIAFPTETIGHEIGLDIRSAGNGVFEFYELIQPRHTELLPDLQKQAHIPYENLGTPAQKRFVRFAFVIDTRGNSLTFIPKVDNISYAPLVFSTNRKQTVVYYFTENVEGTDIGGDIIGGKFFELYGIDYDETLFEKLPTPTKFIYTCTTFDQAARKRFERFSVVLNTKNRRVRFTAITDGIEQESIIFNSGDIKKTYSQYFTSALHFVNLCYRLEALDDVPFEFYEFLQPERLELLPEPVKFFPIPATNLGNDKRKRFITYAIIIDTFGATCTLNLYTNENLVDSSTFSTSGKQTYIHYFTSEVLGTDIRAELSCDTPFEFWDVNFDETISEVLPAPTKFLVIPAENLGVAAKKRIRTIPFVIHTRGGVVRFTPKIDGVPASSQTFSTSEKRTELYYAESDFFGIDIGGTFEAINDIPFEFYGFGQFLNVQTLPVGRKLDQVGPVEVHREAWLRRFEIRCVATGASLGYTIYAQDVEIMTGSIITTPNVDKVYRVDIQKTIIRGTIFRIKFHSDNVFHRYHVYLWHSISGGTTELQIAKFGETEV